MNSDFLVYQAKSFYNAYIALSQIYNDCDINEDKLLYHIPMLVNGAFSIEISIKAILTKIGISYDKEHNLYNLFCLLPGNIQGDFWQYIETKAPEYSDHNKRLADLLLIANAFADLRYCFEDNSMPPINTRIIEAFANAAIYTMFDLGYNCDLIR